MGKRRPGLPPPWLTWTMSFMPLTSSACDMLPAPSKNFCFLRSTLSSVSGEAGRVCKAVSGPLEAGNTVVTIEPGENEGRGRGRGRGGRANGLLRAEGGRGRRASDLKEAALLASPLFPA